MVFFICTCHNLATLYTIFAHDFKQHPDYMREFPLDKHSQPAENQCLMYFWRLACNEKAPQGPYYIRARVRTYTGLNPLARFYRRDIFQN